MKVKRVQVEYPGMAGKTVNTVKPPRVLGATDPEARSGVTFDEDGLAWVDPVVAEHLVEHYRGRVRLTGKDGAFHVEDVPQPEAEQPEAPAE